MYANCSVKESDSYNSEQPSRCKVIKLDCLVVLDGDSGNTNAKSMHTTLIYTLLHTQTHNNSNNNIFKAMFQDVHLIQFLS